MRPVDEQLVRKAGKSTKALLNLLFDGLDWPLPKGMEPEDVPLIDWKPADLHLDPDSIAQLTKIQQLPPLQKDQPFGVFVLNFEGGKLPVGAVRRVVSTLVRKKRAQKKTAGSLWGLDDLIFFCQSQDGVSTLHVVAFQDTGKVPVLKVISWNDKSTDNRIGLVARTQLPELAWPNTKIDADQWRTRWRGAFTVTYRENIKSAKALAMKMAEVAKTVRDEVTELYEVETDGGPLRLLHKELRASLRADMSPKEFADMYAQTMVYGLLTARITHPEDFYVDALDAMLKFENPFLDALYAHMRDHAELAFDPDEFGLHDLAQLLAITDVDGLLADFGVDERKDDPVVFFYEEFLQEYDPTQRKELGAYYTPIPVVRFMVRAVDEIIKTEFGLPLGVADRTTWSEYSKQNGTSIPKGVKKTDPVIRMIDPATGTGTFLLEWLRQAERNLRAAGKYTPAAMKAVVEQVDAFEISLSSYAVAHLKTGLELDPEVRASTQLGIRLTDTLAGRAPDQLGLFDDDPIARERQLAEVVKFDTRHSVLIGNPPYLRTNREAGGGWMLHPGDSGPAIFDVYLERALRKTAFGHTRSLFNLYTYFWRFAHWKALEQVEGPSVISYITASSWLTGPGFLGIREIARELADEIYVVDLGGDNLGTRPEENVFPIQIPVAIVFLVRRSLRSDATSLAEVRYVRIEGTRAEKLASLQDMSLEGATWDSVLGEVHSPLVPTSGGSDWSGWPLLGDLFPLQQPGCKWARTWPHSPSRAVLMDRWALFMSKSSLAWREKAFVTAKTGRKPTTKVGDLPRLVDLPVGSPPPPVLRYGYRSFDRQWSFADERISDGYRPTLWASSKGSQVFMATTITGRLGSGPAATVSTSVPDYHYFNGRGGKDIVPLFRDPDSTSNSGPLVIQKLSNLLRNHSTADPALSHQSLFAYCFGVLACTDYTERFREELETPGPRVPLTRDPALFAEMAAHGEVLLWLQTFGERFQSKERKELKPSTSIKWRKKPSRIPIDSKDFSYDADSETLVVADGVLLGVGLDVWNFEVSGMKVIKKWLGYRTAKGAGRAAASDSPLDQVRPTEWEPEWSEELREIVHVLTETEKLRPRGVEILDRIMAGELISADELPEPPAELRKPPGAATAGALFDDGD